MDIKDIIAFGLAMMPKEELSCPKCNETHSDWWEEFPHDIACENTDWEEIECRYCDHVYKARVKQILSFEVENE